MTTPALLPLLQDAAPAIVPADTAWMLVATALVLLMTPALAFFYGGLVRSKNSLNTMMMSFVALGVVGILWALVAYSLAFAEGGALARRAEQRAARGGRGRGQGHHPAPAVHGLPGHLRHHHGGAHLRGGGGADAVRSLPGFHPPLDPAGLRPGGPLGLGRRLAHDQGCARLRRRYRGPHQCRHLGAGGGAGARGRGRTTAGRRSCPTTCPSCCSAPACSGSAGSVSTAAARWPRTSSPALAFANTFLAPMATLVRLAAARLPAHRPRHGGRRRDRHRGRPGGHHPRGGIREPGQRPPARGHRGAAELFRHRLPLPHPAGRLPRRLRRSRPRRHHRGAAHRRLRLQGVECGRQRRPAGGQRRPAWHAGARRRGLAGLRRRDDLRDPQAARPGRPRCVPMPGPKAWAWT